ncbi:MAG: methionyl-tRNA formyltransferase [Blastocatellia bacterium]
MKLLFMGTPEFAVPALEKLLGAGHEIGAVFTQPDKPVGRKQIITPPPVKLCAQAHHLPVIQPVKIKTPEARAEFEPLLAAVDACVVAAYGRILPGWWLTAPRLGCVNVHSSLLPAYRGAAPINRAIVNGETETGVTIMRMDEGMDTGPSLLMGSLAIGESETAPELTARLAALGADLLIEALRGLESGEIKPSPQNHAAATYAPILKREDGLVNWNKSAWEIYNHLRGFTPFPGCYTTLREQRIELVRVQPETATDTTRAPGEITQVQKDSFVVACGHASQLRVHELQPAGKNVLRARDFLNGTRLQPGVKLG